MTNSDGTFNFAAQIYDEDSNVCIFPDYECQLYCSLDGEWVQVDCIFSELGGEQVNLTASKATLSQEIVKQVTQQAVKSDSLYEDVCAYYQENA